jgi:hypothetical protein
MAGFHVGFLYYVAIVSSDAVVAEAIGKPWMSLWLVIKGVNI